MRMSVHSANDWHRVCHMLDDHLHLVSVLSRGHGSFPPGTWVRGAVNCELVYDIHSCSRAILYPNAPPSLPPLSLFLPLPLSFSPLSPPSLPPSLPITTSGCPLTHSVEFPPSIRTSPIPPHKSVRSKHSPCGTEEMTSRKTGHNNTATAMIIPFLSPSLSFSLYFSLPSFLSSSPLGSQATSCEVATASLHARKTLSSSCGSHTLPWR